MQSLFVVTHKEVNKIPEGRVLIGVGRNDIKNVEVYDCAGENIAGKNANYCELTALYWIWKNSDAETIGLEHYRRFFCSGNLFKASPLTVRKIQKILVNNSIILPKPARLKPNIYDHYAKEHFIGDLDLCETVISEKFPEYLNAYKEVMLSNRACMFNMFIAPKKIIDDYCEWLFGILFEVESRLDISDRDTYQKRVYGFLSERLFNVWLYKQNLKTYYARVYNIGEIPLFKKARGLCRRIAALFRKK